VNDLTTLYAHARYDRALGHEKVAGILDKLFGLKELTPEQQRVRALVEQSVTDEQLARQKALSKLRAARERLTTNTQPGSATKLLDFARALVPGLSITAAPKDDGITKQSADLPEESVGGRAGDIAQALAVLSGAGLGAGIQRGAFGGHRAAELAAKELGTAPGAYIKRVGEHIDLKPLQDALTTAAGREGIDLQLAAQKPGTMQRIADIFSPQAWSARLRRYRGENVPVNPQEAAAGLQAATEQVLQSTTSGELEAAQRALASARRAQRPSVEAIRTARTATDPQTLRAYETSRQRLTESRRNARLLRQRLRTEPLAAFNRAELATQRAVELQALAQRNLDALTAAGAQPRTIDSARTALERAAIATRDAERRAAQASADSMQRINQELARTRALGREAAVGARAARKTVGPSAAALHVARRSARAPAAATLAAKQKVSDLLKSRETVPMTVSKAISRLREGTGRAMKGIKSPAGWKAGAGIGALALALPLALLKYQQVQALRRRGGTAAASSYREAVEALQRAEKLKQWRQQQLKALPA